MGSSSARKTALHCRFVGLFAKILRYCAAVSVIARPIEQTANIHNIFSENNHITPRNSLYLNHSLLLHSISLCPHE